MDCQQNLSSQGLNSSGTPLTQKILGKVSFLDIFSYTPIPLHSPEARTSKRSLIGSLFLLFLMVAYVVATLIGFLTNNVPKTSQQEQSVGSQIFTMPNIAMTNIPNISEGISFVDQSYYSINIAQGVLYQGLGTPRNESLLGTNYNCTVNWLTGMNFTSFVCPAQLGVLQGNLLTTSEFHYIKISILTCKNGTNPNVVCQDTTTIQNFLRSSRFFLFIQQDSTFYQTPINAIKALFYYAAFEYNQKYEIYLQNKEITTDPDYFHSFSSQKKQALFYLREKTYIAELLPGSENEIITIWLRLNEEASIVQQAPQTAMTLIGGWGALWGVLVSIAGFYFLNHNQKKFYKRNPHWQNFESFLKKAGLEEAKFEESKVNTSIELTSVQNR